MINSKDSYNLQGEYWIGPNYWPAHAGIRMWTDWRPDQIQIDLERMISLGFTVNRSFLFMPDFMPTAKRVDPIMLERFIKFLQLCNQAGIKTLPSFFVGHMSGEDWDTPWRKNRNFYTDPLLLEIQKVYVQTIVNAARHTDAVAAWIASNEIYNYEPNGSSQEIADWGRVITEYIKEIDPLRPVSLGEGARGPETSRHIENFETRKFINFIDFIGLHFYPRSQNPWHQSFTAAFRINISQFWQKPVIVEEFGHSTTMGSELNQANYYRTVLYSALINGAVGTLNWCYSDFDLYEDRPYIHHPFEMRFGLIRTNGELRPSGQVMSEFSILARELCTPQWEKIDCAEIALLVPSNYYYKYPHDYDTEFLHWYPLYLDVFSHMKRAGLSPRMLLEPAVELEKNGQLSHQLELDPGKYPVLILPRFKRLTAVFWQKLIQYVKAGGTLYTSFAQDSWIPDWEEVFGITSDLKFGLPAQRTWQSLDIGIVKDWADFKTDTKFYLSMANRSPDLAYCPIVDVKGDILLADQDQHPVLIRQKYGQGQFFYSPYPLEMIGLSNPGDEVDQFLQKLYKSIWQLHGKRTEIAFDGQDLEYGIWKNLETRRLKIIVLNHSDVEREGTLEFPHNVKGDAIPNSVVIESPTKIAFRIDGKQMLNIELQLITD